MAHFDYDCVLWGIDGDFEFNAIKNSTPFVSTDHCGTIRIFNQGILAEYLMIELDRCKHHYGFDRGLRSSLKNMMQVTVEIPVSVSGDFDVLTQQEIIERHNVVTDIKTKAKEYERTLKELTITVEDDLSQCKEVLIGDIFELPSIKGVTKEFIQKNKGEIPVYGGKQLEEPIGYISQNLDNVKYFNNCLAWNRNGTTGYVFFHKHEFTTTDDHRPMFLKKEYENNINLEYARISIENILLQRFSWNDKAGKDKVEKIAISIPTHPNGDFDLEAQQYIADKYKKIEEIKALLSSELKRIIDFHITQ